MILAKEDAIRATFSLPDDVMYGIYVLYKVAHGLEAKKEDRTP